VLLLLLLLPLLLPLLFFWAHNPQAQVLLVPSSREVHSHPQWMTLFSATSWGR
jgi:hypothetical protein